MQTMAFSRIAAQNPTLFWMRNSNPRSDYVVRCDSVSFRGSNSRFGRSKRLSVRFASVPVAPATEGLNPAISLTDNALKHLNKMRSDRGEDLCLRIGVKQGGCSGMSYTMDLENRANARPDDSVIEYQGFTIDRCLKYMTGRERVSVT
ncbi:PREDICTED: iron-sulfur assembly protein IscA, chloroplastic isoform X2 [Tarenaya hassleriana]|uniref:iron-sulfur assembly protein IscA, chloroplastic isoform X2 n=1 Tax=Tarenaya hassleriana TaxID=28532 RepID=UPI00053C7CBB|nr:PREDICTED: iron-sulfur assembly protein IscA, chloroplastic isoform X2 [Tarenaya hassleriana]